jgi:hypothetical protein
MSDPKRLFDDGADDLGKALLRAGKTLDEEQARDRKLALLGAAGAAAAAAAATPSAAKGALHLVSAAALKWLGVGLLAAAVAAGGAAFFARSAPETAGRPEAAGGDAPPDTRKEASNTVNLEGNAAQLEPSGGPQSPDTGAAPAPTDGDPTGPRARIAAPSREAPHVEPKAPQSPAERASAASSPGESLSDEVAALKKAREALAAGRPKKALTELNIYDKRFRGGRLALEAEVLRIEALAQSGEGKAAAARAASFLAAHPSSPYAHRIRTIAEAPEHAASE